MEHYGSAQQLAVTNMETAVIVASFDSNVTALPASVVELQLDNGQNGTVSDVQPFPGQANVFLIEVCVQTFWATLQSEEGLFSWAIICVQVQHPASYEGKVTVSLPQDAAVQPLSYSVVSRPLVVQNLGFDVCSAAWNGHSRGQTLQAQHLISASFLKCPPSIHCQEPLF